MLTVFMLGNTLMLSFFHGWRRKMGCVTLVLACAFGGLWINGVPVGADAYPDQNGAIAASTNRGFEIGYLVWETTRIDPTSESDSSFEYEWNWQRACLGFVAEKKNWRRVVTHDQLGRVTVYVLPYWSIVVPLTLLSAYLLLSKPGPKPSQTDDNSPTPSPH